MRLPTDLNPFSRAALPDLDDIGDAASGALDDAAGSIRGLLRSGRSLAKGESAVPAGRTVAGVLGSVVAGVVVLGASALAIEWVRERHEPEPALDTLRQDGPISLRRYRPMIVATAAASGSMKDAMDNGFRRLFRYITGKVRPSGDDTKIAMTVPVIAAPSDHPGGWLIRFVMPAGKPLQALPQPGPGVTIEEVPERLIAAIRFAGRITKRPLATHELEQLRGWMQAQGLTARSEPVFAAYNSPIIPGAMRRNEWWIEVGEPAAD